MTFFFWKLGSGYFRSVAEIAEINKWRIANKLFHFSLDFEVKTYKKMKQYISESCGHVVRILVSNSCSILCAMARSLTRNLFVSWLQFALKTKWSIWRTIQSHNFQLEAIWRQCLCSGVRPQASKWRSNPWSTPKTASVNEVWSYLVNQWDGLRYTTFLLPKWNKVDYKILE